MAVVLGSGEPEGHGRALLRLLDEQRKEGRFCDVMVQVGRARFAAHRCILAACSPFLCQKLDATSSDATPEVLHLDMLQADAFAAVLQFLYTAQADNKEALANGAHALDVALPVPADPPAMSELESPVSLTPCVTAVPSPISPSLCRSRYPYSISERINRVGGANSRCRVRRRPARVGWFEQHGDADDGSGSSDNVEDNVAIGQTTTLADFPSCGSPENCSETEIAAEIAEALTSTGSLCHITCSPAAAAAGDSSSDQDASDVFGIGSIPIVEQEDEPGLSTILKDGLISGHLALPSLLSPENTAGKEKRAFACSCCGKRFPRASDLRKHERSHSDERPFACPLCRRAFKHRSHLNDHERRHRGLRPFPCTFCPKAFAKASDLKRHQNTMHGTRTATGISISRRISLVEPLLHQIVGT